MEEADVSIEAKGSGFLNESSISDMFGGQGSVKDMSRELSAILAGKEASSAEENQLDQCIVDDPGDDKEEAGGNLADMLKDVLEEDRLDDDLGRVHRFSKPILSESDLEEQKEAQAEDSSRHRAKISTAVADDTHGNKYSSSMEAPSVTSVQMLIKPPETTGEMMLEGEEEHASSLMCHGCTHQDVKSLLQTFCVTF